MWALPASLIVLIIFNITWGHFRYLFTILTTFLWSTLISIHLQLLVVVNAWPIYLVGIPLQIGIVLWSFLVKRPKEYIQQQREERKAKKQMNVDNSNTND